MIEEARPATTISVLASPGLAGDSANPYTRLLYRHLVKLGVDVADFDRSRLLRERRAVWHLHWPETVLSHASSWSAFRASRVLLANLDLARLRGVAPVWTVHNITSHETLHPRLEAWFWRAFTRRLRGFITLSEAGRREAIDRHPRLGGLPNFVVRHGHYRGAYPDTIDRSSSRSHLDLPERGPVLLFLGRIRSYKGARELITAVRSLDDQAVTLVVAGEPADSSVAEDLVATAAADPRIQLRLGFVAADEIQVYLRAADILVLPYRDFLHSGVALLALSFDCPVLVPDRPAMAELEDQVGSAWVQRFSGQLDADDLSRALEWSRTPRADRVDLTAFEWDLLAPQTLDAYRAIIRGGSGREAR